ncbi:conserved unknown protein [Ectocarpus siliculosus]|uniref:Uncharacterized protein n=1 Tax=Ectocarpus siliculosus TaxID=2880 RepID=D8LJY2_ECTSI|nr:conserved unknown protein [Ectocarpus siliculosus]|eukprot:CBN74451.1 conserved unknown protein [Ectocarpus siliculosus]
MLHGSKGGPAGCAEFEEDDVEEEPEERRWLGDDGEIVVELPRGEDEEGEDGDDDGGRGGESSSAGKGKGKEKAKARRFTAEETKQALSVHKAHLACLVARCAMVSRWAGDPTVQAAMVSCLPSHLAKKHVPARQKRNRRGSSSLPAVGDRDGGAAAAAAAAKKTKKKKRKENGDDGAEETREDEGEDEVRSDGVNQLRLADLVVWFREFITVLNDDAVGGSEGSWGSRPQRLQRVIEQRAGCAQEAVQLFVSLCRGLGLRARYVACLDPVPPSPAADLRRQPPPSKQTRNNTVDLAAAPAALAEGKRGRRHHHRQRRRGSGESRGGLQAAGGVGAGSSQAWAEVLCREGKELHVLTEKEVSPSRRPPPSSPPPAPAASPRRPSKRQRTRGTPEACLPPRDSRPKVSSSMPGGGGNNSRSITEALSMSSDDEDTNGEAAAGSDDDGHGARQLAGEQRRQNRASEKMDVDPPPGESTATATVSGARARPTRAGSKRKAAGVTAAAETCTRPSNGSRRKLPRSPEAASSAAGASGAAQKTDREAGAPKGEGFRDAVPCNAAYPTGGRGGGTAADDGEATANGARGASGGHGGGGSKKGGRRGSGSSRGGAGANGSAAGAAAAGVSSTPSTRGGARERWIHVDPVVGALDQADKVQDLRFRKRLMPYVVAEDEKKLIVDVTRRYSSEWARTLRTRGRAMASADGWWNRSLRKWGASAHRRRRRKVIGTGAASSPLVVEGHGDDEANEDDDQGAIEEKELQEKVDNEPIPNTIAALKNHHKYVLGKKLLKFEALRPGAKAAGLVKGSKVYLKTDVATLRGASRWKKDALQVKKSELEKPVKLTTKKGEKEGDGTSKLYGDWQTEPWAPEAAVDGKVPKNDYGNVEFFDCSPAFLPTGTAHLRGEQIGRLAAKLGVDYAPALTGFETKVGRQVPVLDGIIVCKEQSQMLRDAHMTWQQTQLEKQVKARRQRVLRRWRTLFKGVLLGAQLLEEYGSHD